MRFKNRGTDNSAARPTRAMRQLERECAGSMAATDTCTEYNERTHGLGEARRRVEGKGRVRRRGY